MPSTTNQPVATPTAGAAKRKSIHVAPTPQHEGSAESLSVCPPHLKMRYLSVQVTLADGSSFFLPGGDLLWRAAHLVAVAGITPETHMLEQILPSVIETPTLLLDMARKLTWPEVQAMARNASWCSPMPDAGSQFWLDAELSLAACQK